MSRYFGARLMVSTGVVLKVGRRTGGGLSPLGFCPRMGVVALGTTRSIARQIFISPCRMRGVVFRIRVNTAHAAIVLDVCYSL